MKKNFTEKELFQRVSELTNIIERLVEKKPCRLRRLKHLQYQISHLRWKTLKFEKVPYEFFNDPRIMALQSSYRKLEKRILETATAEQKKEFEDNSSYAATLNSLYIRDRTTREFEEFHSKHGNV